MEKPAYGLVYLITNVVSGMRYVGITTKTARKRWTEHLREGRQQSPKWPLHRAIAKYGEDAFHVEVLERCEDRADLNAAEVRRISEFRTKHPAGYNLTDGGGGASGFKHSEEMRQFRSRLFKGRTYSEDTKKRMSAAALGRKASPETRAKQSASRKGTIKSAETRARIGAAHRGKKLSHAQIERMRAARTGKPLAETARVALQRSVTAEGVEYASLSAAADALGVSTVTIARRIEKGWTGYSAVQPARGRRRRTHEQIARMRERASQRVLAAGTEYALMTEAASALGMTRPGVAYRIKAGHEGYARL